MATVATQPHKRIPGPYPAGRVCAARTCKTVLSTYNGTSKCWTHHGWESLELSEDFFSVMAQTDARNRRLLADELAELMEKV